MPVITFISDFGGQDTWLSSLKAYFACEQPECTIIDVSHRVKQGDVRQAAWLLRSCFNYFPAGTIHVVLTGISWTGKSRLLLAEMDGYFLLVPDSGILSLAFSNVPQNIWSCTEFNKPISQRQWLNGLNSVITELIAGKDIDNLFQKYSPEALPRQVPPRVFGRRIDCNILHIDRYGNIVLNITQDEFLSLTAEKGFNIKIPGVKKLNGTKHSYETNVISHHYNDVAEDRMLVRCNSAGYMEIAINRGSAAARYEPDTFVLKNLVNEVISIHLGDAG